MKRKSIILFVALIMICICKIPTSGATGTIRLALPPEMKGEEVYYQMDDKEQSVKVQEDGKVVLENLASGDYKIRIPDAKGYEFSDIEVRVPTWSEEEKRMLYDISIEPKYQSIERSPLTGDESPIIWYGIGSVLAMSVGIGCIVIYYKKRKIN